MIAVGCPVFKRDWIIEKWYEHIVNATRPDDELVFVLVGDPVADLDTFDALRHVLRHELVVVGESEPTRTVDTRDWGTPGRIDRMVDLRNKLLETVRKLSPEMFLSIDSDILLHPQGLEVLRRYDQWDAVGGKVYMGASSKHWPSYAFMTRHGGMLREESEGHFKVDVIMALKLMYPRAYEIDYVRHKDGEDIGWSLAARRNGLKLGWDGTVTSKHVMDKGDLLVVDKRCGY